MSQAFARSIAMMALITAAMQAGKQYNGPDYKSRGHGEGCSGNKHARSSFKQNKRRGL